MSSVYLGIGSNLGERAANIAQALSLIDRETGMRIISRSPLYEFPALTRGNEPQPAYLNGAAAIETTLEPQTLLDALQTIERKLGRPADHGIWQPRAIDLDILLYGDLIMSTPRLTIPHPEMTKRMFVLKPLCDIAPRVVHPVSQSTVSELYTQLTGHIMPEIQNPQDL